jgi:hypothetical protein
LPKEIENLRGGDCACWFSPSAVDEKEGLTEDCLHSKKSVDIFAALFHECPQREFFIL